MTSRESNISDLDDGGPHSGMVVRTPPQVKQMALVGLHLLDHATGTLGPGGLSQGRRPPFGYSEVV